MRYQEARHVGEALTRDALRQLATTIDAPPSSTIVVNSTARHARRVGRASRSPAPVRCTWSRSTTAPRAPPRSCARSTGEGISTVVVGQKIRWVLEMMRGPELAGARIARVERPHAPRRQPRVHVPRRRSRRDRARPRGDQGDPARVGRGGCHHLHPPAPRAGARGRRGHRSRARLRLAHVPRGRGRRTRHRGARRGARPWPTSTCGSRSIPPTAPSPSRPTASAWPGAQPLRRRRRRWRHLQLLTTRRSTPSSIDPSGASARRRSGPGASANRRHRLLPVARARRR